ncbi:hypothetical protein ABID19_006959, partial [Mesorhizobium robiniae]
MVACRKPLAKALKRSDGAKGGRPPFEAVMMFKVLVLQALYSLSDDQAEFQIQDRLSFSASSGWGSATRFPTPRRSGCLGSTSRRPGCEEPVRPFDKHLTKAGYLAMGGQI